MLALLVFGLTLLLAVLLSELANRTVVSLAVLFLIAGFAAGSGGVGLLHLVPENPVVASLADFALVAVLISDGMKLGWRDIRSAWRLPGRALLLGLPLTLAVTAALAHYVAGVPWPTACLIGAVLSPTDPVFAAAIVGREEVSPRLRKLLNVESGLNDGLALPFVLGFLALATHSENPLGRHLFELASGCAIGVGITWLALRIEASRFFSIAHSHAPFLPLAIGLVVFTTARLLHSNEFLAAFSCGVTLATLRPDAQKRFHLFGEQFAELLKLAALLVFAALISPQFLSEIGVSGYLFAALVLVVARPVALAAALWRARIGPREKAAAMWFGPKGFASVVYGLIVLQSGLPDADHAFHLIAIAVIASIIAHSSTDVVVARWLKAAPNEPAPQGS